VTAPTQPDVPERIPGLAAFVDTAGIAWLQARQADNSWKRKSRGIRITGSRHAASGRGGKQCNRFIQISVAAWRQQIAIPISQLHLHHGILSLFKDI